MVISRSQNKITDFLMILAWASPFKFILPEFVSYLGERGAVCGKRLIFMYISPYEHVHV